MIYIFFREKITATVGEKRRRIINNNITRVNPELLDAHGRVWNLCVERTQDSQKVWKDPTRFRFPSSYREREDKLPLDYFQCSFPKSVAEEIVKATNIELAKLNMEYTNITEIYKFLGIRTAMAVDPLRGNIADYWKECYDDNSVFVPRSAEKRFCMSYWRFRHLSTCFRLRQPHIDKDIEKNVCIII